MNNLKKLREKNSMSQQALGEKLQISQQAIAKWESGETMPQADKLLKLAEIFCCTLDELFGKSV